MSNSDKYEWLIHSKIFENQYKLVTITSVLKYDGGKPVVTMVTTEINGNVGITIFARHWPLIQSIAIDSSFPEKFKEKNDTS